jgi:ATP-dependent Zn protease
VRRIIDEAQARARIILQDHRETLDEIAARLIEQETVDAAELKTILDNAECRTEDAQRGGGGPGSES